MECYKLLIIIAVQWSAIAAEISDTGPQTFIRSPPTTHFLPQQYGVKEVTMYLTSSQVQSLQSGDASLVPKPDEDGQYLFIQNEQGLQNQDTYFSQQQPFANPQHMEISKPVKEEVNDIPPPPVQSNSKANSSKEQEPQAYSYFHFNSDTLPQDVNVEIVYPKQDPKEYQQRKVDQYKIITDPLLKQKFKLIPYKYNPDDEIKSKINQDLKSLQLPKELSDEALLVEFRDKLQQNTLSSFKYAPKYSENNYGGDIEEKIKSIRLEQEKAHAEILKISKSPPVIINKEVKITKHRPVYITKHVKVPVPTPVLVPYPQYVEVKVPQPYPVPLEIINHASYPIIKKEKNEEFKFPFGLEDSPVPLDNKAFKYIKAEFPYASAYERLIPEIKQDKNKKSHY